MAHLVLNVDDFEPQRYHRSAALRRAGFDVVEASSGREALSIVRERRPHIVVLDVHLPDTNGLEVCRQIKGDPATAAVLVLQVSSTFVEAGARVEALNSGADAYLPEPLEPEELVGQVRSLLRLSSAERLAREREERYRFLFNAIDEGFCIVEVLFDDEGRPYDYRFLEANPAFVNHTGLADATGKTIRELVPNHESRWFEVYGRVALTGESIRFQDAAHALGRFYDVYAFRVGAPEERHVAVLFNDISERTRMEEALRDANARLSEADRRKDEFLAVLSHELRNPLAPIRYAVPLLRDHGEAGERAIKVVERQVDHLTRLVDDLLTVSRIATGKLELRLEHVTLQSVVRAAVEGASPAMVTRHDMKVEMTDEPIWLYADRARVAQVITNLLDNGTKYTPQGGHITLEAGREGDHAAIRVRDTGIGIPPAALPRVFDMFWQAGASTTSHAGLGIGLALVKRLVEMHDGTIEARSAGVNQGTEFIICLPVAQEGHAVPAQPSQTTTPSRRLKVLTVDDNADLVEMLSLVIESAGHEALKASDGRSALSAAASFHPDVVLLDVGLPDMSGLDVARALRRNPKTARVLLVALTGWGQVEDRRHTSQAGFDFHLTKPTDPETVLRMLADFGNPHRVA